MIRCTVKKLFQNFQQLKDAAFFSELTRKTDASVKNK